MLPGLLACIHGQHFYTLVRICFYKDLLAHSVKYFHVGHWFRRMVLMQFAHSFFLELFSALANCIHCAKYSLIWVTIWIPDAWPLNSSETFNCSVLRQQGTQQNDPSGQRSRVRYLTQKINLGSGLLDIYIYILLHKTHLACNCLRLHW